MQIYNKKEECYGCTACLNICPVNAIKMETDKQGFKYAVIDEAKCIKCGLCKKTCPYINLPKKSQEFTAYAAKNKNEKIRMQSTSGGIFTELASYIINKKGIVYGASLDKNLTVVHTRIDKIENLELLRGSKYVQSDLKEIFKEIKKELENHKLILFSGTPCQVAGLKKFLKKDYNNLVLVDLICHGVPSPLIFKEQIKLLEKKSKVKNYLFRVKKNGWHTHTEQVEYENGKIDNTSSLSQRYKQLFNKNLILRPCCFECQFSNLNRVGDITIGDYWGVEKYYPEFDDNKGINLVILNTKRGIDLFNEIKNNLNVIKLNREQILQQPLQHPSNKPLKYDSFWNDYYNKKYNQVLNKYTSNKFMVYVKKTIKSFLNK